MTEVVGRVASVLESEQELCRNVFPDSSQAFKGVVSSVVDEALLPLVNSDDFCNYSSVDDIVELVTQVRHLEARCGLETNESWTERAKERYIETELGSMNAKFKGVLKGVGGVRFAEEAEASPGSPDHTPVSKIRSAKNPELLLTSDVAVSLCRICCGAVSHATSMYLSDPPSLSKAVGQLWGSTCVFFLHGYILPLLSILEASLPKSAPSATMTFPQDGPHDLGIGQGFWGAVSGVVKVCRIYDAAVWGGEGGDGEDGTVSEILAAAGVMTELTVARERRIRFVKDVEKAGGNVMGSAIGALADHVKWILVSGEQAQKRRGGDWAHNSERGAYSISNAEDLDSGCSLGVEEMVKSLNAALDKMEPDESRDHFWNALMERAYDVFIDRILNHLKVSVMGSIVLSRDVEAIGNFCKDAAGPGSHCVKKWEHLRELLCVFVTPPEALPSIVSSLLGGGVVTEKDTIVKFLARRSDWRSKGGLSRR